MLVAPTTRMWIVTWGAKGCVAAPLPVAQQTQGAVVACRERKKAKVGELQGMVTALSDKLQELTTARNLNSQLRERNRALAQVHPHPACSVAVLPL